MAQDHELCRKKESQKWTRRTGRHCRPVLQLPTGQSRSLQTVGSNNSTILAHMEGTGAKQNEQNGASDEKGSVHGKGEQQANIARRTGRCRQTQPADAPSGTGLKETTSRWPVLQKKQQLPQMMSACRAVGGWECSSAGSQKGGCRPA